MSRMSCLVLPVLFLFLLAAPLIANDAVFYSRGGTLVPMQETRISLKKELLVFRVVDFSGVEVEIDFEFFNPDGARTLTVGFVTPPASGDVPEDEIQHPKISKFTVMVNGKRVAHKVALMSDTSFNIEGLDSTGSDFVYYFPVTFRKGVNKIRHTYRFEGGASVETQRDFDYQITTGKKWANGQIDDFELQLHLDPGIFFIPASFSKDGTTARWKIIGDGVFKPGTDFLWVEGTQPIRLVHLNDGYVRLKEKNFKPDNDILVGEYNWAVGWITKMCRDAGNCPSPEKQLDIGQVYSLNPAFYTDDVGMREISSEDLRIYRNVAYALRGYDFRSADLVAHFSKFFWYKPDPSLVSGEIELTEKEKEFAARIAAEIESRETAQ